MEKRRKARLSLIPEAGEEDTHVLAPDEGPYLSGDSPEDLICARCERTLCRGVRRAEACRAFKLEADGGRAPEHIPGRGTAAEHRPFPFIIECDCGALNRVWPIIPA